MNHLKPPARHTFFDDFQGIFTGTLFVSLALVIFNQAGLLTGGTAGLAFVLHYATGMSFGKLFFLVNLPFYWFAWHQMGREFTIKTFLAIGLLSLLTEWSPSAFQIAAIHPLYAALVGGLLLGTGCLFLARHRASLGGATIVGERAVIGSNTWITESVPADTTVVLEKPKLRVKNGKTTPAKTEAEAVMYFI